MPINPTIIPSASDSAKWSQVSQNFQEILNTQFTIVEEGLSSFPTVTVQATGAGWEDNSANTEITHNLGYTPLVMAYINFDDSQETRLPLNYTQTSTNLGGGSNIDFYDWTVSVRAFDDKIQFRSDVSYNASAAGASVSFLTEPVKYFLFRKAAD